MFFSLHNSGIELTNYIDKNIIVCGNVGIPNINRVRIPAHPLDLVMCLVH